MSPAGRGRFGEVYTTVMGNGERRAIKIQKILPNMVTSIMNEIEIARELSSLKEGFRNMTTSFPTLHQSAVVYDQKLRLDERIAGEENESSSDEATTSKQLFALTESNHCGTSYGDYLNQGALSSVMAVSVLAQTVAAVAVAEAAVLFEHRDMHAANILLKATQEERITYVLEEVEFHVNACGVEVAIIDYGYSRITKENRVIYLNMDQMNLTELPEEDQMYMNQHFIYYKMLENSREEWEEFKPQNNLVWVKHLLARTLHYFQHSRSNQELQEDSTFQFLLTLDNTILSQKSLQEFLKNMLFVNEDVITF